VDHALGGKLIEQLHRLVQFSFCFLFIRGGANALDGVPHT
jgi:hypothetical protein